MLREIKNREEWNELVQKNSPQSGGFLGSWEWGEFQERVGRVVRRFAIGNEHAQAIEHALPFGKCYWYVPRGGSILGLSEIARKFGALFIRFEPLTEELAQGAQKTMHVSPQATSILNLTQSEEALLAGMHEKTRYNIRLAERKGVRISESKDVEIFWRLLAETARRDGFRTHAKLYYEKMLNIPFVELWVAQWEGRVLAAGLWTFFGDTVTYLHGASSSEDRNVMAPYLLHWQVMRDAKARGFKAYDLWGIQSKVSSPWAGMTRFKAGFGGEVVEYPGTFDLPLLPLWYRIYKLARKIRRM